MNKKQSRFIILGHVLLVFSLIGIFLIIGILKPPFLSCVLLFLSDVFTISLVYGLGDARTRISELEFALLEKKVISKEDLDVNDYELEEVEKVDNLELKNAIQKKEIVLCKKCNYQIFPDETKCSYCGEPRNSKKIKK